MGDYSVTQGASPGQRAASYWFEDGLPELVFGLALVVVAGVGLLWRLYLPYIWMKLLTAVVYLMGVPGLLIWGRKVLDFLKARVTYPRTGYARPPTDRTEPPDTVLRLGLSAPFYPASNQNVTSFGVRIVALFINISVVMMWMGGWSLPLAMIAASAVIYSVSSESEHPYSFWSVLLLALSGFLPLMIGVPERGRVFLPPMLGGLWLLTRGLWTFIRYLRQNPYPREAKGLARE